MVAIIVNAVFLRKFKRPISGFQIEVFSWLFFLSVSSVFIIFHSHFLLSLEQQSDREHISIRSQISKKLLLCHHGEIKTRDHIEFCEKLFNLELSSNIQDNFYFI